MIQSINFGRLKSQNINNQSLVKNQKETTFKGGSAKYIKASPEILEKLKNFDPWQTQHINKALEAINEASVKLPKSTYLEVCIGDNATNLHITPVLDADLFKEAQKVYKPLKDRLGPSKWEGLWCGNDNSLKTNLFDILKNIEKTINEIYEIPAQKNQLLKKFQ